MAEATNVALIMHRLNDQDKAIGALEKAIDALKQELVNRDTARAERERRSLIAGIIFLGSIITSLGGVIWAYRAMIFQGRG